VKYNKCESIVKLLVNYIYWHIFRKLFQLISRYNYIKYTYIYIKIRIKAAAQKS